MAWLTGDANNGPGVQTTKKNSSNTPDATSQALMNQVRNIGTRPTAENTTPTENNGMTFDEMITWDNGSSDYNGGSQAEWNYYFGDEDEDDSSSYWDSYLSQIKAAEEAQKKAIQAGVQQSVNTLNAQKDTTAQDYADQYRQLYLQNMKSQKNIGQQMAAQGVTGGASESTLLGLNTNYEDNLRQGKVAEQNAYNEIEQAIANAQLSGSIEEANAAATSGQNAANAYLTAWQQALANEQAEKQLAASQESENKSYDYQMAMAMLNQGIMPSDALLNGAGISKADAQAIVAKYVAAQNVSGYTYAGANPTEDSGTRYVQTNNYGATANEATDLENHDYAGVLAYLKLNLGTQPTSKLNEYIDRSYSNDLITKTQKDGLKKFVANNS